MENRQAIPYISHIRITKRPTRDWQPTGYQNQQGQDLYQQVTDLPGIQIEVTPYLGEVKAPARNFGFPSRTFFEQEKAKLDAIPVKSDIEKEAITNIEATLARTDLMWCETVLQAAGLQSLDTLWADVFSDVLDSFPSWKEEGNSVGGIPIEIKEMQWDARVPADGAKSIDLKVGVFCGNVDPEIYRLTFEDAASRVVRLQVDEQIQSEIDRLTLEVGKAEGKDKAAKQQQLDFKIAELARRKKIEVGLIADVVSKQSVKASLPNVLVACISVLKTTVWPDVDVALFTSRLADALAKIS